jgi:antitoxin ParD1/3/4
LELPEPGPEINPQGRTSSVHSNSSEGDIADALLASIWERRCLQSRGYSLTNFAKIGYYAFKWRLSMATMNVSLPDPMKDWVEAQARTGRYSNASDYVRDLIRRDQTRNDKIAAMQSFVEAGLQSGVGIRSKDELFAEAVARASKS